MPGRLRLMAIRLSQPKFTVSAAIVLLNERNEVLLLDHVLRPYSGWGLPGGFIGHGEQPEKAIRREVKEETGIEIASLSLFRVRTLGRHVEFIFRGRPKGDPQVKSSEIIDLGWFDVEDVPEQMPLTQVSIIRAVLSDTD